MGEGAEPSTQLTRGEFLRRGVGVVAGGTIGGTLATRVAAAASGPTRGGTFVLGMIGGGSSESVDPNKEFNEIDIARIYQLYERLVTYDAKGRPTNQLASEFSPNKDATVWKMKILPGVHFHDGSVMTAADVVYSLQYMASHKAAAGYSDVSSAFITAKGVRALDSSTVEFTLTGPNAILPTSLAARTIWIFKHGTTNFTKPNGTGPFKFKSFTAGENSVFVRNDLYRQHSGPYIDAVEIVSFSSATSCFNALVGGQTMAMSDIDFTFVPIVNSNPNLTLLVSADGGGTTDFTMACDLPPFNNVKVRQAFRLLTDRKTMVANALSGHGVVGNDLFWPTDPDYASALPQRQYDPEQAKSLLKAAGHSKLKVTLYTSTIEVGQIASAEILQADAAKIGVTIDFNKVAADVYYSDQYLKTAFGQSGWSLRPLTTQFSQVLTYTAPFNETHWHNAQFESLVNKARGELNPAKRKEMMVAAQTLLYDEGGYIVWGFYKNVDAVAKKVQGLKPADDRWLGAYNFRNVYLS
jgi:peptide/nickel transport system substrate-binding protein